MGLRLSVPVSVEGYKYLARSRRRAFRKRERALFREMRIFPFHLVTDADLDALHFGSAIFGLTEGPEREKQLLVTCKKTALIDVAYWEQERRAGRWYDPECLARLKAIAGVA